MLKRAATMQTRLQLPLFAATPPAGESIAAPVAHIPHKVRASKLWICIYLPDLILEAIGSPRECPAVAVNEQGGVSTVCAVNSKAANAGVLPGVSLQTALALCPALDIRQRRGVAEQALLQAKANWALAYTPVVSVDAAGALLLEVHGSLRLFGGLDALRECLRVELRVCGHRALLATAPVAKAALWLARCGYQQDCSAIARLPAVLATLPLACLDWPVKVQQQLLQMGVATLGDCMRLPRDGFARRVGAGYLRELEQGHGQQPELLSQHQSPVVFNDKIELTAESLVTAEIDGVLYELLLRLERFLLHRQVHARQLQIHFGHLSGKSTLLELQVRRASAAAADFMELLRLQLERQVLPAPVCEVSLRVEVCADYQPEYGDLLRGTDGATAAMSGQQRDKQAATDRLVERLRARLGMQRVYGLMSVPEHRPEHAWRSTEACAPSYRSPSAELVSRTRPLWLLREPQPLSTYELAGMREGLAGAANVERIESGWWDGADVRRDYYRMTGRQGRRLWIYQDGRSAVWYVHGLFA